MSDVGSLNLKVLNELKEFIVPLSAEEKQQLEENIIENGCREPLTVWKKNSDSILVDGHHRYAICNRFNVSFEVRQLDFASLEDVKVWMINNQLGRRNLTQDQLSYYRGLKYLNLKKSHGGYEFVESKGQNELSTASRLSEEFKVSDSTIKRDAKYAMGLEIVGRSNPDLKRKILIGDSKVKKSDIQLLSSYDGDVHVSIKNEADIYNKAQLIRKETMEEIEAELRKIEEDRVLKAQQELQEKEPLFLNKEDKLTKLKGRIISAINSAIKEKDVSAIEQLRRLIDLLESELLG